MSPGSGVTLVHRTAYRYARPARLGPQIVRLRPLPDPRRPEGAYRLHVDPFPLSLHWMIDPEGNQVARLVLPQPLETLVLEVELRADLTPRNAYDFLLDPMAATWPFAYGDDLVAPLARLRDPAPCGPLVAATATPGETVGFVRGLAERVRDSLAYVVREEPGVWTPDQTLAEGRGSCRDSAWLLVQALRMHGFAARFVSGYLVHRPEDGGPPSAELHAWAETFLPGPGWIGLDATSGFVTAQDHIGLAAAATPAGAAPLSGTVEPVDVVLETGIVLQDAG